MEPQTLPDLLKDLRDIHLPTPVSWWPLAPFWYIFLALVLIVLGIYCYSRYRIWKRQQPRKLALERLDYLEKKYHAQRNKAETVAELSILLKRSALQVYPRHEVAGLQGHAWLLFLDRTSETKEFTEGNGALFVCAPYAASEFKNASALFELTKLWIEKNL